MSKWKIQGSRVYGQGQSYNLINRVTAEKLHKTLTQYEAKIEHLNEVIEIEKQLKIVTMDLTIIKSDLDNIKERLEAMQ